MRLKREQPDRPVWLMGVGEGGLIALFAGAADGESIDAVAVCGYFDQRDGVWQEPIYRNVWRQLVEFGDAELASLIAPRPLVIEQGVAPEVDGPPAAAEGQQAYAAPGAIVSPAAESVRAEFARAQSYFETLGVQEQIQLVESGTNPVGSSEAILALVSSARSEVVAPTSVNVPAQVADPEAIAARDTRQVAELIRHTQRTLHRSDKVRDRFWREADRSSVEAWEESAERYRDFVHDGFIGKLPIPDTPLNVRSRLVIDEPSHVGYEIVLDVIPPAAPPSGQEADWGVIAGGILLLPKNLREDATCPVVVCQHGLEGVPMDTITTDQSERAWRAYKGFSTTLVRRGFIVYAPQNPYRGFDAFRVLQRKSNPVGEENVGYCLSICSADFNEWIRKNASTEDRYSYVLTREYEIFEWNMGHIAGYAELSSLMAPRPFMVERGHHDGVAPDEWVGWEFARVRRHYDLLGIGDRTEIEWFVG
ncbi:Alpha/beta hydrolase family protein, partial [Durusdinium trenchii]